MRPGLGNIIIESMYSMGCNVSRGQAVCIEDEAGSVRPCRRSAEDEEAPAGCDGGGLSLPAWDAWVPSPICMSACNEDAVESPRPSRPARPSKDSKAWD